MPEVAVQFHQVSYRIAGTEILSNLDLEIRQGETVVLLGRSGCGKTTTLKLVNRLLEPTSGEVRVEGRRESLRRGLVPRGHRQHRLDASRHLTA